MNQERYWRNLLADEIKAEHDKVRLYYEKRGMNNGGMSNEEHTRLNIFLLCESIARTMKDSEEYIDTPDSVPDATPEVPTKPAKKTAAKKTAKKTTKKATPKDPVHNLVKDTPQQNEFGEIL